jgi:thiamine pyrophosphate-dependent acetolactate synthase large subunit-like protein
MGVRGFKATTAEEFNRALAESLAEPGPSLIEAVI